MKCISSIKAAASPHSPLTGWVVYSVMKIVCELRISDFGRCNRRLGSSISIALIGFLFATSTGFGQVKFLGKGNVQVIQFSTNGEWLAIGTTAILEVYSTHTYQVICVIDVRVDTLDFSQTGRRY